VKLHLLYHRRSVGGRPCAEYKVAEPAGGYTTVSVTHGQSDARPAAYIPSSHRYSLRPPGEGWAGRVDLGGW